MIKNFALISGLSSKNGRGKKGNFMRGEKKHGAKHYAALICAAMLICAGAASAQQAKSGAEWRTEWRKKWASEQKAHTDAWRAEWRKEWVKQAKRSAPSAAPKSAASAAPAPTAPKLETKPETKPEVKAALPPVPPSVAAVPAAKLPAAPAANLGAAPAVPPKNAAASAKSVPKSAAAPPASVSAPAPSLSAKAAAPAPVQPSAPPASAAPEKPAEKPADNALSETRPDPAAEAKKTVDKPLDSPMGAIGDGGRMFLCLIPTVLVLVAALHLLRRFQEKNGRLPAFARIGAGQKGAAKPAPPLPKPGILQSLLGGINRSQTTERGSIRVIESVPVGGSNLHLIEVRGKTLLLGASASGVNLLTEIEEADSLVNNEFRLLLEQAAGDMDSLGLTDDALPASLLVGTLDDPLRDANRAITRGTRRLRTVQETEAEWEREGK